MLDKPGLVCAGPSESRSGLHRRRFLSLAATAAAALHAPSRGLAAPPLSETNYGIDYSKASRANAWLEIDADALAANISAYRQLVGPGLQSCFVVKGDAYGNGLALLMPTIKASGLDFLGIASNDEARIVRSFGFTGRLMRLRIATLAEIEDGLDYRIEELIGSERAGRAIAAIVRARDRTLPFHLALNSAGMSREGIDMGDARGQGEAATLARLSGLSPVGVMAHFPVNSAAEISRSSLHFRKEAESLLRAANLDRRRVQLHCANSFATLNVRESWMDLVRPGRIIYGYGGDAFPQFRYLATLKSRVASINRYPRGATVSYERTFTLRRDSVLANIPIGASDGLRPIFSQGDAHPPGATVAHMVIRGFRAPVVGRVTMNTVMVDVTDFQDRIDLDDEVTVFGPGAGPGNAQTDFLRMASTNPPDLMTVFGNSLPKVLKTQRPQ
jgi:alanine racemase